MACNRVISYEEFLDQKPPIEELIEQIDAENEWLMFGVILGLTKDAIYQLPTGVITGKTVALIELWLHAPNASRRQLLLELRKDPDQQDVADNYERHLNDTYQAECKQSSEREPVGQSFVSGKKSRETLDIEEKLETKDCVIQELQDNICNYKEQIKDIEEKLRTKNSEIEDLQSTFEEKENEMKDAKTKIKDLERSLSLASDDMNTNLEKKDQEIDDLKNSIIKKDDESDSKIQELQSIIHEKEKKAKAKIEELEGSLSSASDEKSELKRNLETKDQEINDLKVSAQKKDEEAKERIEELEGSLSLASDEKSELKRNLETKDQEINDLKVSIKEKDEEMKGAKERIEELEGSLSSASDEKSELKRNLETKDQEINDLKMSAQEKDEEAKERIEELEGSLSLASDEKSELKRNLETKIQELDDLKVSIKEKDEKSDFKIRELQNSIREKEEELLSSQQSLKRKEKEVNTLSEGITAKEIELASFRKLSEEQVQEIVALKLKLMDNQKDIAEKESVIKSTNEELSFVRLQLSQAQDELELQRKSIDELEEKIGTLSRISRMKDREIEGLKARLYPRNEQDMITNIKWGKSEVRLTSPSAEQCKDVLTRIEDDHRRFYLSDSSSDVAQLLIVPLLQKKNISTLYILSTSLARDFIDLFSTLMSDDNTLESLYLNYNSIDDVGVITLVQSLKYNKKLQYLSLDFNAGITSLSVPSLAEFIRINCTLSVLYVSHTRIDTKGVLELVDSLKFNTRLGKIVVDLKHKAICSQFVGKTNRLDFSYTTATAYEYTGVNLGGLFV